MKYVDSIKIMPKSIVLGVKMSFNGVYIETTPNDTDYNDFIWESNNTGIVEVDENGIIHGISPGNATITITNPVSGNRASINVQVIIGEYHLPVSSIGFAENNIAMNVGNQYTMTVDVSPIDASCRDLVWYSSNEEVVTVNDSGCFTAVGQGVAKIYAYAIDGSGMFCSCNVAVSGNTEVKSIAINPSNKKMNIGDSEFFDVNILPSNASNKAVYWTSSNNEIAMVNPESGLVIAQSLGSATICATARDGSNIFGICNVNVIEPIRIQNISIDNTHIDLDRGCVYRLNATVYPENATIKEVNWRSSRPSVATIDPTTGLITAKSAGDTIMYATAQDGSEVEAFCTVSVRQTVTCSAEETHKNRVAGSRVSNPVDVYTGSHTLNNTLMSLFGGQNIQLIAHYDSTYLTEGELGVGWYHNYEKCVYIYDGGAVVFNNPSIFSGYISVDDSNTKFTCYNANKNGYVLTVDNNNENYPYIIDCNSERIEYYDSEGNLAKIKNHQGFETYISHVGNLVTITDGITGKSIYLEKNPSCRIVRIFDDAEREVRLTYDENLLTEICDENGNRVTYNYDENMRMKSCIDAEGICCFENNYDEYGRISEQKDAIPGSNKTVFTYRDDIRITTDRNGNTSSRVYDCNGVLISCTDENGHVTTYDYDDRNNVIRETDANLDSVVKYYNKFNKPVFVSDKNGNSTYFSYDSNGNLTKVRYPSVDGIVPTETFTYNERNQMIEHVDIRGTVTNYTYYDNGLLESKKTGINNPIIYTYEGGLLKSQTDSLGNTTRYEYNDIGQIVSKIDANNNITRYVYDLRGNILKVIDAEENEIVTTYDGNYQKITVTDANGNITRYSYDGNMNNNAVILPDGNTISYEFDGEDRVIKIIDQKNNETLIAYDSGGRVRSKTLADGGTVQYEYDPVGNVTKEINAKGAVTTKTYDGMGNVLTVTDNEGNVTSYEYNAMSKVTKITNALGGVTTFVYSAAGDLLSETNAFGKTKTYTYDEFGNRLTATDAKNNTTTYTYDQNNNLITVKDALGYITTYTYNNLNQCKSVKDALNNVIEYGYDALGRRTTVKDARGKVFTTFYDGNGNVVKTTDAKGNTISETVYTCLNQPLEVTDAMGKKTTYTYDACGNVKSIVDPMNYLTEFTCNFRGQNTSVRDAANGVSSATYDVLGNVTRITGPLGGSTNYAYDNMGRLTSETTVSNGVVQYSYNALNVRNKIINARGQAKNIEYDAMGRITRSTSPEGIVTYTYDDNGNVLRISDTHGTIAREYDALNRVTRCIDTFNKAIRYQYDAVGNLTKITYPDNSYVRYLYDANRNLIRVIDWANRYTIYSYDENNRVTSVTKPNGSTISTTYDNMQRVTSTVERAPNGAIISGFEYTYDNLSRIIEEKVLANSTKMCYTYNNLNRVVTRTIKNLSDDSVVLTEMFVYDSAGNITFSFGNSYAYDTNNRLTEFNGNSISYDPDGNMLSDGLEDFTYDSSNRLIVAKGHGYTYNAENVRIRNLCEEEDTIYTYDTNCKLSKLLCKTTNGVTTKYVYGRGLIGEETNNVFKTYHFDNRGSTVAITNFDGGITDTFTYDTYGKCISRTGTSSVIFGYNGRDGVVTDSNGLIYMRARYYAPYMKRFINADIIAGDISNAVTLNRFAYANGNPVSFVDPTGLMVGTIVAACILGGALLGLTGCTKQEESASSVTNDQPSIPSCLSPIESNATIEPDFTPKITSAEQARALYLSGEITFDEIPPQYHWEPSIKVPYMNQQNNQHQNIVHGQNNQKSEYEIASTYLGIAGYAIDITTPLVQNHIKNAIINAPRPNNIKIETWGKYVNNNVAYMNKSFKYAGYGITGAFAIVDASMGWGENVKNGESKDEILSDIVIDLGGYATSAAVSAVWDGVSTVALAKIGSTFGTVIAPGVGTAIGVGLGIGVGMLYDRVLSEWFDSMNE